MRILVTEQGKKEITSLSLSPINTRSLINTKSYRRINKTNSNKKNNKLSNNFSTPYLNLPKIQTDKIQNYKLKQNPLINLISRLYDSNENKYYNLSQKKGTEEENSDNKFHKNTLSLYNIINKDAFNNMIFKIKKEQRTKEKNTCALTFKFRESLSPVNNLEKLEKLEKNMKNYKIPNNNVNFIRYIKAKKEINPIILNKIIKLDNSEIEKEDKICKIILNNTAYENFFNEKVKERLKNKDVEYQKDIRKIKYDINEANSLIDKYPIQDRFSNIREKHEDFKLKYWTKRNKSHNRITSGKSKLTASTQI